MQNTSNILIYRITNTGKKAEKIQVRFSQHAHVMATDSRDLDIKQSSVFAGFFLKKDKP